MAVKKVMTSTIIFIILSQIIGRFIGRFVTKQKKREYEESFMKKAELLVDKVEPLTMSYGGNIQGKVISGSIRKGDIGRFEKTYFKVNRVFENKGIIKKKLPVGNTGDNIVIFSSDPIPKLPKGEKIEFSNFT